MPIILGEAAVLTLYHWEPNANSGKPILTLKEKGVEFASIISTC